MAEDACHAGLSTKTNMCRPCFYDVGAAGKPPPTQGGQTLTGSIYTEVTTSEWSESTPTILTGTKALPPRLPFPRAVEAAGAAPERQRPKLPRGDIDKPRGAVLATAQPNNPLRKAIVGALQVQIESCSCEEASEASESQLHGSGSHLFQDPESAMLRAPLNKTKSCLVTMRGGRAFS